MATLLEFVQDTQAFASTVAWPEDLASFCRSLWSLLQIRVACASDDESLIRVAVLFATASKALAVLPTIRGDCAQRTSHFPTRRRVNIALSYLRISATRKETTLAVTAGMAGLSKWHMSRALAQETGFGFLMHLHGLRVLQTLPLIVTARSVKEMAAAAGYDTTDEYSRHFVDLLGLRPSAFRESLAFAGSAFRGAVVSLSM